MTNEGNERKVVHTLNEEQIRAHRAKKRPRSMTLLKMKWLAERVRKAERIRKAVADGTYHVESEKVARAILNLDPIEDKDI